jgi:hypothetical protein
MVSFDRARYNLTKLVFDLGMILPRCGREDTVKLDLFKKHQLFIFTLVSNRDSKQTT